MLVMHEPMNTSSILAPATSDSSLTSSGSFGQATIGSLDVGEIDVDDGGVLGVGIALEQLAGGDPLFHGLDAAAQGAASCSRWRSSTSSG